MDMKLFRPPRLVMRGLGGGGGGGSGRRRHQGTAVAAAAPSSRVATATTASTIASMPSAGANLSGKKRPLSGSGNNRGTVVLLPNTLPTRPAVPVLVTSCEAETEAWFKEQGLDPHRDCSSGDGGSAVTAVGLDVEWRPSFVAGVTNKVATVQLATPSAALVVQLRHMSRVPPVLRDALRSRALLKVGVGVRDDLKKLRADYGLEFAGYSDVAATAWRLRGARGGARLGLAPLFQQCFGVSVPKPRSVCMSNWEAAALSRQQLQYAAWDALMGSQIHEHQQRTHPPDDLGAVLETCVRALQTGTRAEYRYVHRLLEESDGLLEGVGGALALRRDEIFRNLFRAAGGSHRHALAVFLARLDWAPVRHTRHVPAASASAPSSPGALVRVDIEVQGHLLASHTDRSKALAGETASQRVIDELLLLERNVSQMQLLSCFAGLGAPPAEFTNYLQAKPRMIMTD